ncbi:MAG: FAD-linked oxidase C-terminal domain-containing protein [Thermoflexales bacterium]
MSAPAGFLNDLRQVIPPERLLMQPAALVPYECDALLAFRERPLCVVLPESQEEVVQVVRLCHHFGVPFVARGSGTSLSGGSTPVPGGIVIAMNRLNRILKVDVEQRFAVVEAGVVNLDITRTVASRNLLFAPDPSSQPVCTIGGNVAFNSGGAHCLKYGMTSNHVLALKVVLPDGELAFLGSESLESVDADYVGMFVGSEGLFGIALEVTVRLLPRPETYRTVLAAYRSLQAAGDAVSQVIAAGILPGALEIMDHLSIQAVEAAVHPGYPTDAAALLIVELEGEQHQVEAEWRRLESVLKASQPYLLKAAQNEEERLKIWKGRKSAFSAAGRLYPDYIVQDGVVPRSRLGEALAEIERLSQKWGIKVANVFHAGDGNLHPLIMFDGNQPGSYERAEELASEIIDVCIRLGGSITGEHGVGMEKRRFMPRQFGPAEIACMNATRDAVDPKRLANRGKRLSEEFTSAHALVGAHPLERAGVIARE